MSSLGIYFGPKAISIVETKGKKIINNISIPQSTISTTGELEEKVPSDVKLIEIIALIKADLRRNKIESKEAALCLSGKDLIIRNFEVPLLTREELQSAINFEAKKYIPFKVEDLITDFRLKSKKASHTNLVLFMGIKKETLEKYVSILSQLDIKMSSIEYSAFSVLRSLRLANFSDKGVIGVLGIDMPGGDEINFAVLEDGFPLFSRDIELGVMSQGAPQLEQTESGGNGMTLEKLKTEIRVSLDYYNRKFPAKNIKKIYLICDQGYRSDLEAFISELSLNVSFADIMRHVDKSGPYSLSFIKGYSASLYRTIRSNILVDLLGARQKAKPSKEKDIKAEALSLLKSLQFDYRVIGIGVLICVSAFFYGLYRTMPLRKGLSDIIARRAQVTSVKPDNTYNELIDIKARYKRKLTALDTLVKKQLYLTVPLDVIPRALPNGAWLRRFSFSKKEEGAADLILEGVVYLGDSEQEFETVNKFISNLKENSSFSKYFSDISITSLSREQSAALTVTNFIITCKNYKGAD